MAHYSQLSLNMVSLELIACNSFYLTNKVVAVVYNSSLCAQVFMHTVH